MKSYKFAIQAEELGCLFVLMVLSACHGRKSIHFLWKTKDSYDWIEIGKANKHTRFIIGSTIATWAYLVREELYKKKRNPEEDEKVKKLSLIQSEAEKFSLEAMPK